jgi:hypothetical protein
LGRARAVPSLGLPKCADSDGGHGNLVEIGHGVDENVRAGCSESRASDGRAIVQASLKLLAVDTKSPTGIGHAPIAVVHSKRDCVTLNAIEHILEVAIDQPCHGELAVLDNAGRRHQRKRARIDVCSECGLRGAENCRPQFADVTGPLAGA